MDTKKILWVRLDAIGDAILSASMLPHIYREFDNARITVVCTDNTAELYEACPFVESVIGVDKMRLYFDHRYREEIVLKLRANHFDLAFDSTCSWSEVGDLFLVGSQANKRYAFENLRAISPKVMAKRRKVFTDLVPYDHDYEPEMDRYREFLGAIGIEVQELEPIVWTTVDDDKYADQVFAEHSLVPERTIALFAFGRSHMRTYPYYGEALSDVCKERGFSVIALGDSSAFGFNESCLGVMEVPTVNLSGKTTLRQSAAVLKRCRLAVGAETGLGHLACAVGVPNVIVIGGGHIGRFMPYSARTSLVTLPLECFNCDWNCKFQRAHCVMDIAPEVIEVAVRETLRTRSKKPRIFVHSESKWSGEKDMPRWRSDFRFIKPGSVEIIPVEFETRFKKNEASSIDSLSLEKPEAVAQALEAARSLRDQGKFEESVSILDVAIGENAAHPDLMDLKAEIYLQLGRVDEAKEILWSTTMRFPFDVKALNDIVVVEIMQMRYESALGLLKRVINIDPENSVALTNLRFIENALLLENKLADAEQSIMRGEFESARRSLDEIVDVYPDNQDALTDLAIVEAREGNNGEALKILQAVMAENPDNEFAAQLMDKMLLQ